MNYPKFSLLDLCENRTSGISEFAGEKKYLSTGNLDLDKIIETETITYNDRPSRANRELKINDVIFARMQNTMKVLHIDNEEKSDLIVSTGFVVLHPKEQLLPKYLKFFLLSENFNKTKDSLCNGATQRAINDSNLKKIKIPLPPL
ncbi:MAG: restriction endonuclease subunit S, partial [Candidatus Omnitrophica bacterium]|nr:restriction endonuclease subunit S [Candidatus Omnitrophota bacterium]